MRALLSLAFVAFFSVSAFAAGPKIERVTSPGGIEAWLVRDNSLPLLALQFAWRGGAAGDPAGKEGRAAMTSDLLVQGAGPRDQQEFAAALEDKSISLGFSAGADMVQGSLRVLSRDKDLGIELLADALTRPRFDERQIERIRQSILAALSREETSPETLARRAFARAAFGTHPYARPARGTPDSVKALTGADLRAELAATYARDNLLVTAVGDTTPAELGPMLDRAFGGLPAKSSAPAIAQASFGGGGRTIVIDRPGSQTFALIGRPGISRDDPDLFAAVVVNYILGGGGFNSRLMLSVREREGLTYGIGTGLAIFDHANLVQGSWSSENRVVGRALALVRTELARMGKDGPSEDELSGAKDYLLGSYALQFDGVGAIARLLLGARLDGRGLDWFDEREKRIRAVTLADARRVAARLYAGDDLLVVAVGKPEGISPSE
ncbi:MAG: insulinase family protein [Alphaproteobacteria bacterium]|nr:insulinase family protein [Alphaproteobacteria bacterium]